MGDTECGPDIPPQVFVGIHDVGNVQVPKGIGVEVFGFLEVDFIHAGDVRSRPLSGNRVFRFQADPDIFREGCVSRDTVQSRGIDDFQRQSVVMFPEPDNPGGQGGRPRPCPRMARRPGDKPPTHGQFAGFEKVRDGVFKLASPRQKGDIGKGEVGA